METIENVDKNQNQKDLENFHKEIEELIKKELAALQQKKSTSVHLITHPLERRTEFNVKELTQQDMEMYNRIKNKDESLTLDEFLRYKRSVFALNQSGENLNSRQIFAAYLSNFILESEKEGKIIFLIHD